MIFDTLTYSIAAIVVILSFTVIHLTRTKHRTDGNNKHKR